ncbi:MAG: transcriptional regulator [Spirochaetaceae bacterium]|nr:MAG: transcriptional regulator [Spirochaetaceae bacterium]
MKTQRSKVRALLQHSPVISSSEITVEGVDTKTLTRMVREGEIRRIARGLYTSVDYVPGSYHSLFEASKLVENGVVCLLSALSFHEIGTQNPPEVWLAIPRRARMPQVQEHPIRTVRFSGEAYMSGIERRNVDGVEIAIYNIPKTVADCFKYRNKIGLDVAIESLKDVIRNKRSSIDDLIHFAEVCRVREIMRPYMESLV